MSLRVGIRQAQTYCTYKLTVPQSADLCSSASCAPHIHCTAVCICVFSRSDTSTYIYCTMHKLAYVPPTSESQHVIICRSYKRSTGLVETMLSKFTDFGKSTRILFVISYLCISEVSRWSEQCVYIMHIRKQDPATYEYSQKICDEMTTVTSSNQIR